MGSGCAGKSYAVEVPTRLVKVRTNALDVDEGDASIGLPYLGTFWYCRKCGASLRDSTQPLCSTCDKNEPGHAPVFIPQITIPSEASSEQVVTSHSFKGMRSSPTSREQPINRFHSKGDAVPRAESKETHEEPRRTSSKMQEEPRRTSSKMQEEQRRASSKMHADVRAQSKETDRPHTELLGREGSENVSSDLKRSRVGSKMRTDGRAQSKDVGRTTSKELAVRGASKMSTVTAVPSMYSSASSETIPVANNNGVTSLAAQTHGSLPHEGHKDHHRHHHEHRRHRLSSGDAVNVLSSLEDRYGHKLNLGDRVIGEGKIGEEIGPGIVTGAGDSHGHGMVIVQFDRGGREQPMKAESLAVLNAKNEAELRKKLQKQHKGA